MHENLMSQEEAETLLRPHKAALRQCVELGWDDWKQLERESSLLATSRKVSRANVVYDRITVRAEEYFDSQGIPTLRKYGALTVALGSWQLLLRFRKFQDGSFRTSGIPTEERLAFDYQQPAAEGTGTTHVVVGYLPDELAIGLAAVAIVCSYASRPVWVIDLLGEDVAAPVPVRVDQPQGPTVRSTRIESVPEIQNGE